MGKRFREFWWWWARLTIKRCYYCGRRPAFRYVAIEMHDGQFLGFAEKVRCRRHRDSGLATVCIAAEQLRKELEKLK